MDAAMTTLTLVSDCGTATGALDREMTLEFSRPIDAGSLTLDVQTASPGPS
jgi:hypothetical protein